jgi:hypothetical protein
MVAAFRVACPRRQRRASSVNKDSDWSRVSEPLGPDERREEVDNDGGGHHNSDVGHRRGLLRFLRRRRRTRSKLQCRRARAQTVPAAKRPGSSISPSSQHTLRRPCGSNRQIASLTFAPPAMTSSAASLRLEGPAYIWARRDRRDPDKGSIPIAMRAYKAAIKDARGDRG